MLGVAACIRFINFDINKQNGKEQVSRLSKLLETQRLIAPSCDAHRRRAHQHAARHMQYRRYPALPPRKHENKSSVPPCPDNGQKSVAVSKRVRRRPQRWTHGAPRMELLEPEPVLYPLTHCFTDG